ncbi:hypothetical protein Ari01nite_93390 [Paractinoplanes rishiriensis]|uniref:Uncharacterized protein n=1 Tax=Paractinoplanes rishiriensis TaxID=1050105 RepID=A0A919MZZ0_9ACTN|nr:hypothetical protein Ari01nite_93390 [Actinoplanes rishiriensis]
MREGALAPRDGPANAREFDMVETSLRALTPGWATARTSQSCRANSDNTI